MPNAQAARQTELVKLCGFARGYQAAKRQKSCGFSGIRKWEVVRADEGGWERKRQSM